MTRVVNIRSEPFDLYIGRGSKWGNPYRIGEDGPRWMVIDKYRERLMRRPDLLADLHELSDKTLGCHCKPLACHGDVLIELLQGVQMTDSDTPPPLPITHAARLLSICEDVTCGKTYPGDLIECPHCGASAAFSRPAPVDERDWDYDLETYPTICTFLFIHVASGTEALFEISDRVNQWSELCAFIQRLRNSRARLVGFNSIGFDYEVLHAVITRPLTTVEAIYAKTQELFAREYGDRSGQTWESDRLVDQIDLMLVWHFDNRNKNTSLKALEIAMCSESVVDLPFPPGMMLDDAQKDVLIKYNRHDVKETMKFHARSMQQLQLRESLSERYGVNMLNMSNTKIGSTILIQEMEAAGIRCFEYINKRKTPIQTYRSKICLGDVIFPYIRFERPEFNRILDHFRATTITETKGAFSDVETEVDGFVFVFGLGGIHGSIESQIVESDEEFQIVDVDVTSFYPRMAVENGMYPAHLGPAYCATIDNIFQQRASFGKGTPENLALKETLNAAYGNSNNAYSPLFDPFYTMQTTINGQLMLCMLAEQLMKIPRLTMVQANTDGITVRCPRAHIEHLRKVCKWWEGVTRLQLEEALYSRMLIRDVNNYIAVYEGGKVKRKGAYEYETQWHQDPSMKIVAKAAEACLVYGKCLATFIVEHTNPFDFMLRAKVPKTNQLVMRYAGGTQVELQKTTRYFASVTGGQLFKIMPPTEPEGSWKRKSKVPDRVYNSVMLEIKGGTGDLDSQGTPWDARIHTGNQSTHQKRVNSICAGYLTTECADVGDFEWSNVDYGYYVAEASKLVDPLVKAG